ncbi:alpha/beta hydrolase [Sediminimonas qiaohouensis]|uniref:alpha/beta hydrolase n=1 Tax=Sediminimonas qiaohouensis TaxID=552061 RepID=UPI0023522D34|nr:alpha/beta hydrolase [Sediminimonas qiaohouensis]
MAGSLGIRWFSAVLRAVVKPRLSRTSPPTKARGHLRLIARLVFRQPGYALILPRAAAGGAPPMTRISVGRPAARRVILYFHGGGYIAGSPATHAPMLARLAKLSGVEVRAPAYRLAPGARFPAAFKDAKAAFRYLLKAGYRPGDIVLGGDSAGGGLALALLAWCCAQGLRPAGAFAMSPWTDLTGSGASMTQNAARDAYLPAERLDELAGLYLGDAPRDDPRASPLFAVFDRPPPVLLQVSESEILRDDTLRMAARLRAQGGDVTVQTWEDAPHVWQVFDGWLPEARAALRAVASFVQTSFAPATR